MRDQTQSSRAQQAHNQSALNNGQCQADGIGGKKMRTVANNSIQQGIFSQSADQF
jgi:hypothetical protein